MKSPVQYVSFLIGITLLMVISCKKESSCFKCLPNKPPVAAAGADRTIQPPKDSIILDGRASTDPDGKIMAYKWKKLSGPASGIIHYSDSSVTDVKLALAGTYAFQLTVTDNGDLTATDTLNVVVYESSNQPPVNTCSGIERTSVQAQLIPVGMLSFAREGFVMTAAGNKILFAGGDTVGKPHVSRRVDIYNTGTDTWSTADLSEARLINGAAVHGNKIYFAGGLLPVQARNGVWAFDGTKSAVVDIYDASNNSWTRDKLPVPGNPIAGSTGNKLVFAGGDYFWPSADAFTSDGSGNWLGGKLSSGRRISSVTTIGNKIYFAGGDHDVDWLTSDIDIYDAGSNSWTRSTFRAPYDRGWTPSGIAVANKNYWAGGQYYSATNTIQSTDHVEIRDMATNVSTFACLFQPNYGFGVVSKGNKIVFFTGAGKEKNKFDIYDHAANRWSIGVLDVDIEQASILSVNNTIYVAGGFVNGALSKQVWKLEF